MYDPTGLFIKLESWPVYTAGNYPGMDWDRCIRENWIPVTRWLLINFSKKLLSGAQAKKVCKKHSGT